MRRIDLQRLAEGKLEDATILSNAKKWSNAYYLAGYTIELGLKACIARQISSDTIPDKSILKDILSHEFIKLVGLAGLRGELRKSQDANPDFAANWAVVSEWSPDARYRTATNAEVVFMLEAISHPNHGVLPWIKNYW